MPDKGAGVDRWAFHNPVRLVSGVGCLDELSQYVGPRKAVLVTSPGFSRRGGTARVKQLLGDALLYVMDDVRPNPELAWLEETGANLRRLHRSTPVHVLVAVGGGSVIDSAKVLSTLIANEDFPLRAHLEGALARLPDRRIPVLAIPTTAGTGSEVTPFATVWDSVSQRKYSLSGTQIFPEAALLDASLTLELSRDLTVVTGLDAVSQALESVWNRNANPLTIMMATAALKTALPAIRELVADLGNVKLRSDMLRASLLSGLAISHTRTALAHSMSYPITMHYGVPHGLACSFTLPAILKFNSAVDDGRLEALSRDLGFGSTAGLHAALTRLLEALHIRDMLRRYVTDLSGLQALVDEMITPDRAGNNLRHASAADLREILRDAWVV